ncbi:MAG: tetratricopeptide repeat protein, partial [Myxococcota bacterium]
MLFLAGVLITTARPVLAEPSAQDRAMAQSLFEQGRDLMAAQRYDRACPKFAESHRLDPGGGTLLNLARCYELAGRTASAWTTYEEALAMARRDGRADRARHCLKKLAALEPKIAKITIAVPSAARIDGLEVQLGERSLREAAWFTPLALDPGEYEVVAAAPGRRPWSATLVLAPGDRKTVEIPVLETTVVSHSTQPPERGGARQPTPVHPVVMTGFGSHAQPAPRSGTRLVLHLSAGAMASPAMSDEIDDSCNDTTGCSSAGMFGWQALLRAGAAFEPGIEVL